MHQGVKIHNRLPLILIVVLFLSGCKRTGYDVTLRTQKLKYSAVLELQDQLKTEGFKDIWVERKLPSDRTNTLYTFYRLNMGSKNVEYIQVALSYSLDADKNIANNFSLSIGNKDIGLINDSLRNRIDMFADTYEDYLELANPKEPIIRESKEHVPLAHINLDK